MGISLKSLLFYKLKIEITRELKRKEPPSDVFLLSEVAANTVQVK